MPRRFTRAGWSRAVRGAALGIGGVVLFLISGCPSPRPTPIPAATASASASAAPMMDLRADIGAECREKVLSLQDWLKSIEDAGLPLAMSLLDEGASLVAKSGPAITDPAPLVHVTVDRTYLDGVPVADSQALETELTELIELRRSMMPESPFIKSPKCHLAIGTAVTWQRVAAAVAAMGKAGVEQVTFVFSDPDRTVPAPPASPIDGELARMAKSAPIRRGQIIAELVAFVYQDCPEGLRVIANMGVNPIADFKQVILDALPESIGHCACAPDDASVKALHWALFGNPRPSSGVTVRIASPGSAPARVISFSGSESWSTAHAAIAEASADATEEPLALAVVAPEPVDTAPQKHPKKKSGPQSPGF